MNDKLRAVLLTCALSCAACASAESQAAVSLPDRTATVPAGAVRFQFVSDGPPGSGWGRGDRLGRFYAQEWLPAFFSRTMTLDGDMPRGDRLSWIFTGPHAGFTVEITAQDIRIFQRYYDSYALYGTGRPQQNYPEVVIADTTAPYTGHPREITVVLNAHMALQVWANGKKLIEQECLFDVQRYQLDFTAPRTEHDVVAGALLPLPTEEATITVDSAKVHQTIMGFGGSPSIPAYATLSEAGKKKYWEILRSYNLLINREYPMGTRLLPDMSNLDKLADASPHYYGDNFPNGELSDFAYNRRILELGGSTIYEMWDLPAWATQPRPQGEPPSRHGTADPEAYARAMVTYCRLAKEHTGRLPEIVGVQNEVEEPPAVALEMVRTLRKRLDEAGFSAVKIHMADAPFTWQGVNRADDLRKHPEVWQSIDFAAVHEYDYQDYFTDPDLFDRYLIAMHEATEGKPFLATEICLNKTTLQAGSYRVAFNVGQLYHKDMTIMDAVGLLYCWVILDTEQPNFEASRSLLIPDRANGQMPVPSSFQLRVMGAFSRHLQKGMERVDAAASNPDLLATAYRGPGGAATVVVLNRSDKPQKLDVKWSGVSWRELERTSPYLANAVSDVPADVMIQPGEIVTLSTIVEGPAVN